LKILPRILLVIVIVFSIICGLIGVDFGYHWDEQVTIRSVVTTAESGVLLPSFYLYPGLNYLVAMAVFLPTAAHCVLSNSPPDLKGEHVELPEGIQRKPPTGSRLDQLQAGLMDYAWSKAYLLHVRSAYIILSLLAALWTYLAYAAWRGSEWGALLAASLVACSWEIGYHSRWVTPDALMMSMTMLSLWLVLLARNQRGPKLNLTLAAIFAGLACGTKYQGGLALFPVLLMAHHLRDTGANTDIRFLLKLTAIFTVSYLVTTPGTLLDPLRFVQSLWFQMKTYQGGWAEHTVGRGPEHFVKLIEYFALSAFSWYHVAALFLFALTILGAGLLIKEDRRLAMILIAVPGLYVIYMSLQNVMFVRNYLVVIPFLALLAARGVEGLLARIHWRPVSLMLELVLVGLLSLNAWWMYGAAQTIRVRETARYRYVMDCLKYVSGHPTTRFSLSPKVKDEIISVSRRLPENATATLEPNARAVFYATEVRDSSRWDATRFNYADTWFGPYEVNFNYYPTWAGEDRIVILPPTAAAARYVFERHSATNQSEARTP
jgi:hypothetical protein